MNSKIFGKRIKAGVLLVLLPSFVFLGTPLEANPRGGRVVHGDATIQRVNANQLRIHQRSQSAIINWDDFSIAKGDLTRFRQPNRNASVLNRVTTGNVSQIHGQLKANGNVFVVNPNGIVIGQSGVVDVAGNAVFSTLDIDDEDFLDGGNNRFYGDSNTGVTNRGTITSTNGDVILLGGFVDNEGGQIGALNGTVALGSGGDILVREEAGSKISIQGGSDYEGTGVSNTGTIRGASAELKAHGNVYALAINNGGAIRASGATRSNGRVRLNASGGSGNINLGSNSTIVARSGSDGGSIEVTSSAGNVSVGGSVDASGSGAGGNVSIAGRNVTQAAGSTVDASGALDAGVVSIDAEKVTTISGAVTSEGEFGAGGNVDITGASILINDGATISANGHTAGGIVRIGGDFQGRDTGLREADRTSVGEGAQISADATAGDAGTAIVWANGDTMFYGDISASAKGAVGNGGLIEVSGKHHLLYDGNASATTLGGRAGTVLFDPGDVIVGAVGANPAPLGSPIFDSTISRQAINETLQAGTSVLIATESGSITFESPGNGGFDNDGNALNDRHRSIQWTNSLASFGAFASENIIIENHIRTSGGGSINLLAGWNGLESDGALSFDPQSAWDFYVGQGQFGEGGGSIFVGNSNMNRHVIVGSRFGDTNLAAFDVRVQGSNTNSYNRFAQVGFNDMGNVFAPRLNNGGGIVLDLTDSSGNWYLSDGLNDSNFNGGVLDNNVLDALTSMPSNGVGSPIVGVAGMFEVDMNGDGIADGVRGIGSALEDTSDGVVDGIFKDTFIPYANHFDSAGSGNWWWQQIEQAAGVDADGNALAGSAEVKDPLGLGGLRPENGAGSASNGADINVLARGNVLVGAGSGREHVSASIGHGGNGRASWGGANSSTRDTGNETVGNARFSDSGIERNQLERRWTINGSLNDRQSTSIARLAPVYGNINVLAGVDVSFGANVSHSNGTVTATVGTGGSVVVRAANQAFETGNQSHNSFAQIGHGGIGQFGEYYGDIFVEAGGEVILEAGNATRSHATIGHTFNGHAYWNPTSVIDQQIRFFATTGDFDNPNLRRGELFSGVNTTGFDPALDPSATERYTLANYPLDDPGPDGTLGTADDINSTLGFNPIQYTRGDDGRGGHSQGTNSLAPLDLAPLGPVTVNALNGSVVSGLHGDVSVRAGSGDVEVIAYSTPEDVNIGGRNGHGRDRRFAGIGHGGSSFAFWTEGAGYIGIDGVPSTQPGGNPVRPDAREIVVWEAGTDQTGANPDTTTGSRSQVGNIGSDRGRALLYMSVTGDIDVQADGDISVVAGNDIYDYARIGHGGVELADFETSSFMLGDVSVQAGGDLLVQGGGAVPNNARFRNQRNFDMHAWAIIGHGGYRNGFFDFTGDIDVSVDGDITVSGGAHSDSGAKIGHQTVESWGQSGGDFSRDENFRRDSVSTNVTSTLSNAGATIDYTLVTAANPDYLTPPANRSFNTAGTSIGDRNSADISVRAGGGVTLNHLALGNRLSERQAQFQADEPTSTETVDPDNQGQGVRTRRGYSMIGHGGRGVDAFRETNINANYGDKAGNITVIAESGDINLENGAGERRWTRIGHGFDVSDRVDGNTAAYSRGVEIIGDITVSASGDISVNALAADANEQDANTDAQFGPAAPSRQNPVAIGHGGVWNNLDLVVLNQGENVNGLTASSNIAINAGGDLSVLGGLGTEASYAQVGHGFASDQGNDAARRLGQYVGFNGDIAVNVLGDLSVIGGPSALSFLPTSTSDPSGRGTGQSVVGAFAAIGNGGFQLDAPATGDISVYVGGDATIAGQQVADDNFTDLIGGPYNVPNPDTGFLASAFNFGKIGHVNAENSARQAGNGDLVTNADMEGDITVVVNRNLSVLGGTTPDVDQQTIYGAFGQIGHGGPGIAGDLEGNITVLVRNRLTVTGGSDIEDGTGATTRALNNYAMIGNGTRIYDPVPAPTALFRSDGLGTRTGDIVVAAGGSGIFTDALIGHADPAVSSQTTFGNTQVAVSRRNPFFGGNGVLRATENTVFSSGGLGATSQLELYMPARSNNQLDATVRLNEASATYTVEPGNFQDPFPGNGIFAGRDDEVYLTPDLWWDQAGVAAEGGISGAGVFPTDASGDQGGAIANVDSPGGLFNLTSLVAGALGSSAPAYRGGNGVSGSGNYTIYFDAIEFVQTSLPEPPLPPTVTVPPTIFDFSPFIFVEQFESFERFTELLDNELAGSVDFTLFGGLGLFESDESTIEESGAWKIENRLDNLFGDRRDSFSEEEEAEEEESRRKRGGQVGSIGLTFYIFEPGTNQYSSYRVFGNSVGSFYPAN